MKISRRDVLFALTSAVLLVLSFPKHDLSLAAWIGLVPLLAALDRKSPRQAFILSFTTGIAFLMGIYYWINVVEKFALSDFVLLGLFLGSYFGLIGLVLNFISARIQVPSFLIAPGLWVSIEYLRSLGGFLALPWPFLGYSQYLNLPIAQVAVFTGVYGVSFLIVMVNATITAVILYYKNSRQQRRSRVFAELAVCGGILAFCLGYGYYSLAEPPPVQSVSLAVIQGNIPQNIRWVPRFRERNLDTHIRLTRQAVDRSPVSLIIWPETAFQGSLSQNQDELKIFSSLTQNVGAPVLVGSADRPKFGGSKAGTRTSSNSAFLISASGRIAGRYDKTRLLPFGEYLPLKRFPWPSRIASSWNAGEFQPGTEHNLFDLGQYRFAVTICWENIFPDLFRQLVRQGPHFTVNITNEAWFGETSAPYQFLAMNVFRAVENRIGIARAANTGVSAFIDPYGRILGTVTDGDRKIFVEGYLVRGLPLSTDRTFYTRYGDLFALGCIGLSLMLLIVSLARPKL